MFIRISSVIAATVFFAFTNQALAVVSSTSAEFFESTTEGTSSTTNSTKKLFSSNVDQERVKIFVDHNFDRLQEEAARGSGVLITDYVNLMGCQASQGLVIEALQKNYQILFNQGKQQLIPQTESLINSRPDLSLACEIHT